MIGVVVWTDAVRSKAVIWCEDQKDLAYYRRSEEGLDAAPPCKGDLVEFEVLYEGSLRIAENILVIDVESHGDLADALRPAPPEPNSDVQVDGHRGADVAVLSSLKNRDLKRVSDRKGMARQGNGFSLSHAGADQESATILAFPERLRA